MLGSGTSDERFNHSDLRFSVIQIDGSSVSPQTAVESSDNYQDHFFSELKTTESTRLIAQFQYKNFQHRRDHSPGSESLITQSTLYNLGIPAGLNGIGDSFTNIPYIQEMSLRYMLPVGDNIQYLNWTEGR